MGKKGKWFGPVKKVFSPESKEKKEEKLRKKLAASNPIPLDLTPSASLEVNVSVPPPPVLPSPHKLRLRSLKLSRSRASMLLWRQPLLLLRRRQYCHLVYQGKKSLQARSRPPSEVTWQGEHYGPCEALLD